jgi:outer membrane PBP1 activator LpoA protein
MDLSSSQCTQASHAMEPAAATTITAAVGTTVGITTGTEVVTRATTMGTADIQVTQVTLGGATRTIPVRVMALTVRASTQDIARPLMMITARPVNITTTQRTTKALINVERVSHPRTNPTGGSRSVGTKRCYWSR